VFGFLDANQTDVTGDGGDSTGISKLYIYSGTPGATRTWTLKATITVGAAALNQRPEAWSMAIDSSNNLHVAWVVKADMSIKYVKLAFSTPGGVNTWTPGSIATAVSAPGANIFHTRIDIDCPGTTTDNPIIVANRTNTNSTGTLSVTIAIKNNSAVWVVDNTWTRVSGHGAQNTYYDDMSCSCSHEAAPDATGYHYVAISTSLVDQATSVAGQRIDVCQVNLATGTIVNRYNVQNYYDASTMFKGRLFYAGSVSNTKRWVHMGYKWGASYDAGDSMISLSYMFGLDGSNAKVSPSTGSSPVQGWSRSATADDKSTYMPCAMTYNKVDGTGVWHWQDGGQVRERVGLFDWGSYTATQHGAFGIADNGTVLAGLGSAYGNAQSRNCDALSLDSFHVRQYEVDHILTYMHVVGKSIIDSPASGATVTTGKPVVIPKLNVGLTYCPRFIQTVFQFAKDAGFTTSLQTYYQDAATNLDSAPGTSDPNSYVLGTPLQVTSLLSQGTWYARSYLHDEFGAWAAPQALASPWTVAHAPAASNLQPGTGSQVSVYGSATTFTWTFSDPYSADVQSAYQVVVQRVSDYATVWDSGKVSSSGGSTSTTIGATYKDQDLRWMVRVWDAEDVVGPYAVSAGTFLLTDPPVVVVTGPSGTITTGIPTITWTDTLAGAKVQQYYRVVISTGGVTIWDTGYVIGAGLSYKLPPGLLSNSTTYTATVYCRDNYTLEGFASGSFTTGYTPPAAPANAGTAQVYLFEYTTRGFVYVSMDGAGYDADFQSYNLYRRKYGTTTWDLINTWSTPGVRVSYQDFTAVSNQTYEYAVTQVVNRFGDIIESSKSYLRRPTPTDDKYWLFSRSDTTKSMPLLSVTNDGYTEEYESETYHIIGRGRHTDYGDRLGLNGSLTIKLRDRMTTGLAKVNYLDNPDFTARTGDNNDPIGWTTANSGTVGNKTTGFAGAQEPTPSGSPEAFSINASAIGTATSDYVEAQQSIAQSDWPIGAGINFVVSFYGAPKPTAVDYGIWCVFYNSANGIISTVAPSNLTPSEYYLPTPGAGHVDFGLTGQYWARYYQAFTTPALYDHMTIGIRMRGTGSGTAGLSKTLTISATQLETGTTPGAYVDGDQIGGQWRGDSGISQSETTGYYTARQMKKRLEAYKLQREYGYLRTPFGDIYTVSLGDMSLSRIAGVSTNEFSDVELPYTEVSF
jgi:hypothetical protein